MTTDAHDDLQLLTIPVLCLFRQLTWNSGFGQETGFE